MKLLHPGPDIIWLGHDAFKIVGDVVVYIDPYKITETAAAGLILVTHAHGDHCSPEDIAKIAGPNTVIVAPKECQPKLEGYTLHIIAPGETLTMAGIPINAVPAYNIDKFRSPGNPYHPKGDGKVGFIVAIGGVRIYHAGDTDLIPEMSAIACEIALLPVSGVYTMTAQEAAQAANLIKPKIAVPMHYGAIVGADDNALAFKKLCHVPAAIMQKGA